MFYASTLQVLEVWNHLIRAYNGTHGFGVDTAEIYGYILRPNEPTAGFRKIDPDPKSTNAVERMEAESYVNALKDFINIFKLFENTFACKIMVNGESLNKFIKANKCVYWRIQVKVVK